MPCPFVWVLERNVGALESELQVMTSDEGTDALAWVMGQPGSDLMEIR